MALPTGGNHLHRCIVHSRVVLSLQVLEKGERFQHPFPSLITRKFDRAEQGWEKAADSGIASDDFLVIVVIRWPRQLINGRDCLSDPGLLFAEKHSELFIRPRRSDGFLRDLGKR